LGFGKKVRTTNCTASYGNDVFSYKYPTQYRDAAVFFEFDGK